MTKNELRNEIKIRSEKLSDAYMKEAAEIIAEQVIKSEQFLRSESIFLFVSAKGEPSTEKILCAAFEMNKHVYVPKCYGKGVMKAVKILSTDDLVKGMYGIFEPKDDTKTEGSDNISLAIVPCVSASKSGKRLGHGAGYYDRFFENRDIIKMCVCFEKLLSEEIPTDEYDVKMDFVVTENEFINTK